MLLRLLLSITLLLTFGPPPVAEAATPGLLALQAGWTHDGCDGSVMTPVDCHRLCAAWSDIPQTAAELAPPCPQPRAFVAIARARPLSWSPALDPPPPRRPTETHHAVDNSDDGPRPAKGQ